LRLLSGALIDHIVRLEWLAAGVLGIMALALLVLAGGVAPMSLVGFILLWGIGSGNGPSLEPMLVSRLFGRKHYPSVYGAMDGVDTLVSIPGPWLGGVLYDLSGSYLPVLLLFGGAFAVGSVGFALLRRVSPPRRPIELEAGTQVPETLAA
jgi:predicted MFS family arabinose efflux permease